MHKLALITGATSGIGWALSHLLAEKGIALILSGRNSERLQKLKNELSSKVSVEIVAADLADSEARKKLIACIQTRVPDLIINNAGYGLYGDALSYEAQEQLAILSVNSNAVLELTLEAAKALVVDGKKGTVLNVASAAAFETMPGLAVYAAAKSCVVQFSDALDYEMIEHGIRVLVSCPGMVNTEFRERAAGKQVPSLKHSMTASYAAEKIWFQILHQKKIDLFDWKYQLGCWFSKYILPKKWVASYLYQSIKKRL